MYPTLKITDRKTKTFQSNIISVIYIHDCNLNYIMKFVEFPKSAHVKYLVLSSVIYISPRPNVTQFGEEEEFS